MPRYDIVVADDNPANLQLLTQILTGAGYQAREAQNGAQALAAIQSVLPDLVILDVVMPEMTGYEVCQRLKENERTQDIPVLFISAMGDMQDRVKGFEMGGVDYITRPFYTQEVLARVRTHLTVSTLSKHLQDSNAELSRMNIRLSARNAELDAFAHTVAHDLKNPMSMVMGYVGLLERDYERLAKDPENAPVLKSLRAIGQASERMNNIIDELLLLSTVRRQSDIPVHPLEMGAIVSQAQQRLVNLVAHKEAQLILPEIWHGSVGYAAWVEEIWVNYLSNAIKYGGTPPIVTLGSRYHEGDTHAYFWVHDNGAGIAEEKQAVLFTEFTRVGEVKIEGYGLGLSIVKRIIERLSGAVGVESKLGQGSTFWFSLPVA